MWLARRDRYSAGGSSSACCTAGFFLTRRSRPGSLSGLDSTSPLAPLGAAPVAQLHLAAVPESLKFIRRVSLFFFISDSANARVHKQVLLIMTQGQASDASEWEMARE